MAKRTGLHITTTPKAQIRNRRNPGNEQAYIFDQDSSYDEWIQSFDGKVKKLVLLGATKEKIA